MIGAAITVGAGVAMLISVFGAVGMYEKDGPLANLFRNIRDGLRSAWRFLRAVVAVDLHPGYRSPRRPYLSADTVEELEIECYIGPYAEPFRAESLKAREAARRKHDPVRVIEPCERTGGEHIFAMNGRCALCGDQR